MTTRRSVHIGLNAIDPQHYGSPYLLKGCHNDARDMAAISKAAGFESAILLDGEATVSSLSGHLDSAASTLQRGDTFLLTYAGHGTQVADEAGDETDAHDETWLLYDRMFLDDEIYQLLSRFTAGVRVLIISDSCHSGSIARFAQYKKLTDSEGALAREYAATTQEFRQPNEPGFGRRIWKLHEARYVAAARAAPGNQRAGVQASVIQISACQDDQLAADGVANGLFTSTLKEVWGAGKFRGNYRAFTQAIRILMPPTQTPEYQVLGKNFVDFEQERPFETKQHLAGTSRPVEDGEQTMTTQMNDEGNWAEVRGELNRKFPGWSSPVQGSRSAANNSGLRQEIMMPSQTSLATWQPDVSSRAAHGAPITRAFFWGFHIECSSQGIRDFLAVADPLNKIAAAIGPVTGPAAPFVLAAASFIAGALQLIRNLDHGRGVYISMSWFAPGVFIPTTVPGRGLSSGPTRGPGDAYEQAGVVFRRGYAGGLFGLRLEDDIDWNLPDGTIRDEVLVLKNPPSVGNIFWNWRSNDATVGHFRLHVGVPAIQGVEVEIRMMIRDDAGRRSVDRNVPGPRVLTAADV